MRSAHVIVGIDTSPESSLALRWAAAEASRRGTGLRVVHAYHATWPDAAYSPEYAESTAEKAAASTLATALAEAHRLAGDVEVDGRTVRATAAAALVTTAGSGDLVVVGHRGSSEIAALLAGSTCQQVALHAPGPVVVVRGRTDPEGPVVVGYDGSTAAEPVLAAAFDQAAARGCQLVVLRAFRPTVPAWPVDLPPPVVLNPAATREALHTDTRNAIAALAEKYPDVAVDITVSGGDAAQVLVDASRTAQLVVVGSRGHGGFTGMLLGSVGLHLLHRSHCPVLINR